MAVLAAFAVAVGVIASFRLPFLPFAALLLGATGLGLGLGLALLPRPVNVVLGALLLFACAQIGYGVGLAVVAGVGGGKGSA